MNSPEVSIILPIYNEEKSILKEINRIKEALKKNNISYEIICINDHSTDNSKNILEKMKDIKLINNVARLGSGASRRIGTKVASGKYIVWTDVDMTYPNEKIPEMLEYLKSKNFDQVIGNRHKEMGTFKLFRAPAKWFIRILAQYLSGSKIPDLNSGLRVFKSEIGKKFLYLLPNGFSCVSTLTLAFILNNYSIGYFDIEYNRRVGKSKFLFIFDTYQYIMQVIRMIIYFNPLKVFAPLAILFSFLSVLWIILNIIINHSISASAIIMFITSILIFILGLLADLIVTLGKREHTN